MNKHAFMRLAAPLVLVMALAGCQKSTVPAAPKEISAGTSCSLDGMVLSEFPGPKGQIHYASGEPDFFCDTFEMFSIYLQPEQKRRITAIYTQDMGKTDWEKPQSHWIDAKQAYYVLGSKKSGSMGPTLAAFAGLQDAENFARQFGGKVLRFEQVTPGMVDLSGGVMHDQPM